MTHIDPAVWAQLILAAATLLTVIARWIDARVGNKEVVKKLDENTKLTTDIHHVTNGPLGQIAASAEKVQTAVQTIVPVVEAIIPLIQKEEQKS